MDTLPQLILLNSSFAFFCTITAILLYEKKLSSLHTWLIGFTLLTGCFLLASANSFKIDWKTLLEYLKVFLSWPSAAILITLILTHKFQSAISIWISKISRLKATVAGQDIDVLLQQTKPVVTEEIETEAANAGNPPAPDDTIDDMPEDLKNSIDRDQLIQSARNNPIRSLINHWNAIEHLNFERYYIRTFASQIGLINYLTNKGSHAPLSEIEDLSYKLFLVKGGNPDYTFRQFINYLIEPGFIYSTIENNTEYLGVTSRGKRFLDYVIRHYADRWRSKEF